MDEDQWKKLDGTWIQYDVEQNIIFQPISSNHFETSINLRNKNNPNRIITITWSRISEG